MFDILRVAAWTSIPQRKHNSIGHSLAGHLYNLPGLSDETCMSLEVDQQHADKLFFFHKEKFISGTKGTMIGKNSNSAVENYDNTKTYQTNKTACKFNTLLQCGFYLQNAFKSSCLEMTEKRSCGQNRHYKLKINSFNIAHHSFSHSLSLSFQHALS